MNGGAPGQLRSSKRARLFLAGGILLAGLQLVLACGRQPEVGATGALEIPDFRLASLDGGQMGPSSFDGEIVGFDFRATWCLPCHAQADILKVLHGDFDDLGVEFVAVNVGEVEKQVRGFVEKRPFPYPVLMDPADEVSTLLGIYGLPTVMVLNHRGEVAFVRTGVSSEGDLRALLETLVRDVTAGRVAVS
ncbi:MAG: TlpA family protein disulfide reductase [Acidobacteriota bacterium]|nr:TlpA family protein disulfide reductase [Acidobacteriota bacterium]